MDMWPESIGQNIALKPPSAILKEQAALLGNKTKNIVTAEVKNRGESGLGSFSYNFNLVAPAYGYRYKLFQVWYGLEYYPIHFTVEEEIEKVLSEHLSALPIPTQPAHREVKHPVAKSEEEFLEILGKIFSAEKTIRIINALIAESEA
ncbi:MAG: hypothetical protein AB1847_07460 [bacterium]